MISLTRLSGIGVYDDRPTRVLGHTWSASDELSRSAHSHPSTYTPQHPELNRRRDEEHRRTYVSQADMNLPSTRCLLSGLVTSALLTAIAAETSISSSTSTSNGPASTQTAATNGLEVDIIFPRSNATYNLTNSLPIVFAIQNISAAQSAFQSVSFIWGIMPYGNVGEKQVPGGILEDSWTWEISSTTPLLDPYILINTTSVHLWKDGPYFPWGSVNKLQFWVRWETADAECSETYADDTVQGIFFNINLGDPEPDLFDVPECPELGNRIDLGMNSSTSCVTAVLDPEVGNSCAVTVDQAMASSISSVAQYLATSTSTSTASVPSSTSNVASVPQAPTQSVAVAIVVLLSLGLV